MTSERSLNKFVQVHIDGRHQLRRKERIVREVGLDSTEGKVVGVPLTKTVPLVVESQWFGVRRDRDWIN